MKIFFELSENEGYVSPIKTAEALINSGENIKKDFLGFERDIFARTFDIDDLEQIAEHLLIYCKHNKESEVE